MCLYTLYASTVLNNYGYSIIKKLSTAVDPQKRSISVVDRDQKKKKKKCLAAPVVHHTFFNRHIDDRS